MSGQPDEAAEDVAGGLRERKKRQTRAALSQATIALAIERGWANVRVEDVAAAVNVSERTFRNYFTGKAEAVAALHLDRMTRVARAVGESPATDSVWEAVGSALRFEFAPEDAAAGQSAPQSAPPRGRHREAVWEVLAEPAVQAEVMRADQAAQSVLAEVIAARTGTDAQADLYPKLVAAAVGAAVGATLGHWLRADPPVALSPLIAEALEQLKAGLPVPDPAPAPTGS